MTTFTKRFITNSRHQIILLMVLIGVLTLQSCKKETSRATAGGTYLSVVNASPSLATYNVYLNDSQANTAALPFGGVISYLQLTAGDYSTKITAASSIESLLTKKVSLAENTVYSLFLISNSNALDGLLVTDGINGATDKAFIRFINLSPDAPALDMTVKGATTSIVSNQSFKSASAFTAIDPNTYTFDLKLNTDGTVKTSLPSVVLNAGVYYTVISRGLLTPSSGQQNFSAQLITNK
jgi:hypothetical protein